MEVDGMLRIFNRSEKLHNLKYSNYIGNGDTKTFNALSENKPYGDDHLIQKIECVGHVQKRMGTRLRKLKLVYSKKKLSDGNIGGKGRLTDSLIDKLTHYYGNAIRCNSTSVKEMRKAIWAVGGILAALMMNRCTGFVLQIQIHGIAEIAANLATSVFSDGNQILITILEKFGLKINRHVCVYLAERDNRRIFTSRHRRLESSFEARRDNWKYPRNLESLSVISRFWQRLQDDGNVSRCYSTGHVRVTTPNGDRYIFGSYCQKKQTEHSIRPVSSALFSYRYDSFKADRVQTLRDIGLYARRPVRCVPLTATHCCLRLTWSREHALWTPQQWSCVKFSDVPRFSFQSDSRRTFIRRAPGTHYHQENTIELHRYGDAECLVWGGIILGSRSDLHI
ncbi:transposable element Tcb1 transposase [Trichonephila clavipes]|nr:transposable element Tcb1 transposase [Trichonephila clavipes]